MAKKSRDHYGTYTITFTLTRQDGDHLDRGDHDILQHLVEKFDGEEVYIEEGNGTSLVIDVTDSNQID